MRTMTFRCSMAIGQTVAVDGSVVIQMDYPPGVIPDSIMAAITDRLHDGLIDRQRRRTGVDPMVLMLDESNTTPITTLIQIVDDQQLT